MYPNLSKVEGSQEPMSSRCKSGLNSNPRMIPVDVEKRFDRAMEMLNHAVESGWMDAAQTGKDSDADPLRER